jgi:hypothetical protein
MSEVKYTVAPWEVIKNNETHTMYISAPNKAPGFSRSCVVKGMLWNEQRTGAKRGQSPKYLGFDKEDEANAKLIASSPDLLEALQSCATLIFEVLGVKDWTDEEKVKAAIKKATT